MFDSVEGVPGKIEPPGYCLSMPCRVQGNGCEGVPAASTRESRRRSERNGTHGFVLQNAVERIW